ncbi:overexpressed in colon carcinoma 1 protein homolog [Chelmon rostratus]|uniref:overexpressed in colon carcinoma 1 protein homolog n=1 Tax=Chelmon rostratus TaxID=109905 RepID=UPI001BEA4A2B|nr:overexpressed in colon carcinoma 1 protein homolog [Chelmon rostratus]
MGCGNSSPAATKNNSSRSTAGRAESSSKVSGEAVPEDDKWRNYGGVYVGFPADLNNIPQVQIGSLRESDRNSLSLRKPLWGNGL